MSSPVNPPALFPNRKIAPLPLRHRSRSSGGQPQRSENLLNPHPDSTADAGHRSPPAAYPSRAAPHFGQTESHLQPDVRHEAFTFRVLHNITPQPSPQPSPQAEKVLLSSSHDPQTGLSYSTLPTLSTPEKEYSQPLHTSY